MVIDRFLSPFPVRKLNLVKSSISYQVHQQDQCVSVRGPHICASQRGVADGINYMQRNHGVCLLMIASGHRLGQGVGLIDLNCGTFHDHRFFLRSFVFLPLQRMLDRGAFVFEAESSSLRVILTNVYRVMDRILHLLSLCSLGPRLLFQWLSDVIAVKYDALLIVRFHQHCNSLDKGILKTEDLLRAWTLFSYIELQPYCQWW